LLARVKLAVAIKYHDYTWLDGTIGVNVEILGYVLRIHQPDIAGHLNIADEFACKASSIAGAQNADISGRFSGHADCDTAAASSVYSNAVRVIRDPDNARVVALSVCSYRQINERILAGKKAYRSVTVINSTHCCRISFNYASHYLAGTPTTDNCTISQTTRTSMKITHDVFLSSKT
jgi:hypothetical protein